MLSLLNKPWVSGALAIGAVIYVLYRYIPEDWDKRLGSGNAVAARVIEKVRERTLHELTDKLRVPRRDLELLEPGVVRVPVLGTFAKHHQACSLAVYAVNRCE